MGPSAREGERASRRREVVIFPRLAQLRADLREGLTPGQLFKKGAHDETLFPEWVFLPHREYLDSFGLDAFLNPHPDGRNVARNWQALTSSATYSGVSPPIPGVESCRPVSLTGGHIPEKASGSGR